MKDFGDCMKSKKDKLLQEILDRIIDIKNKQNEYDTDLDRRVNAIKEKLEDYITPPKKGYVRCRTFNGWVQFKPR